MDWLRTSAMVTALLLQACENAPGGDRSNEAQLASPARFHMEPPKGLISPSPSAPPASATPNKVVTAASRTGNSRPSFVKDAGEFAEAAIRDFMRSDDPLSDRADCRVYKKDDLSCLTMNTVIPGPWVAQEGPLNTAHYNIRPNWKKRFQNCGKTGSICAFLRLADTFQRACDGVGCRVFFGDFFSPLAHKIHVGHGKGDCVDVLPFRNFDDKVQKSNLSSRNYSRERTRAFIALARAMGATGIIFADAATKPDFAFGGHDDHIHLCFPEKTALVQAACKGDANTLVAAMQEAEKAARAAAEKKRPPAPATPAAKPPAARAKPAVNAGAPKAADNYGTLIAY